MVKPAKCRGGSMILESKSCEVIHVLVLKHCDEIDIASLKLKTFYNYCLPSEYHAMARDNDYP